MAGLSAFDFALPEDRIALAPVQPRDGARLLQVVPAADALVSAPSLSDHIFSELPDLLLPGDLLVFNDTRVIPARLVGERRRGDLTLSIEALLLKRLGPERWSAFAKPGKRLKPGDQVEFFRKETPEAGWLRGEILAKAENGEIDIAFGESGAALDAAIARIGAMPLPPYILEARSRQGHVATQRDKIDYQTIFAARDGAVAAPTAALHFTPALLERLQKAGIRHCFVTLHVGAGTFLPVKDEDLSAHRMHAEWGEIGEAAVLAINSARASGGRIIGVGTTACRLLESAANKEGLVRPFLGETDIFIRPGYRFKAIDALITNFHLPKSTLLMLVAAFCGLDAIQAAYRHAIEKGYRFFSYGDASLLFPAAEDRAPAPR